MDIVGKCVVGGAPRIDACASLIAKRDSTNILLTNYSDAQSTERGTLYRNVTDAMVMGSRRTKEDLSSMKHVNSSTSES